MHEHLVSCILAFDVRDKKAKLVMSMRVMDLTQLLWTNHIHSDLQLLLIRPHIPVSLELEQFKRTDGALGPVDVEISSAKIINRDGHAHVKFR